MRMIAGVLGSVGCQERTPAAANASPAAPVGFIAREVPGCGDDSLRPATAAPAEGLWVFESASTGRVAAMVGPSQVRSGETRVLRRVETMETRLDGKTIHFALDTAVVHLELLPAAPDSLGRTIAGARAAAAAVYAVSPRVLLASYEPCAASRANPRLRYLRRDLGGRPVTDVMLRRTSGGN